MQHEASGAERYALYSDMLHFTVLTFPYYLTVCLLSHLALITEKTGTSLRDKLFLITKVNVNL